MQKTKEIVWDLSELHHSYDPESADPMMSEISDLSDQFVLKYKGNVHTLSAVELNEALVSFELIKSKMYRISQFSHLNYAVDIQSADVLKFVAKVDEFVSVSSNKLLFFFLEIGAVSNDTLNDWIKDPLNEDYVYSLTESVKKNCYKLSEKEEQLINLKDLNGTDALNKLYSEHTSRYEFKLTIKGDEKVMNGSECRALRYHEDPEVRRQAMALFFARYEEDAHIMTHLFNSIIKDYNIERAHRGYKKPIEPMNIGNDLPNDLVDMLHNVTTNSNHLVQRYYKLKQHALKLDEMTLADIYAPMKDNLPEITWDKATSIVLDSFEAFDSDFYEFAKDMFDRNRIHVYPSKIKRGGAFCSSSYPEVSPYVMMNFLGKQRDVATLAHELGHAIHAYFSASQSLINYHSILPICETASVFCEMLVIDALKKEAKTPEEKLILLSTKCEDFFATSHRQNMFSRYEQKIHQNIMDGRMSSEELCQTYVDELKVMFGDSVSIPTEYQWEWASIPHMLNVPFYVYSYNFGNLLVLGLYQLYLDEGVDFIPKLKRILTAGSSVSPVELFKREGIDITDSTFWERSIRFIESTISELESVVQSM